MNSYRHIYLYAKGWYKRSNIIEDLKKIFEARSGVRAEHISVDTVVQTIAELAFKELDGKYKFMEFITRLIHPVNKGKDIVETILNELLAKLSVSRVSNLGKPDPNILPLKEL